MPTMVNNSEDPISKKSITKTVWWCGSRFPSTAKKKKKKREFQSSNWRTDRSKHTHSLAVDFYTHIPIINRKSGLKITNDIDS
jgi:hypothetical protein